jgi:hypothetical protein
MTKLNCIVLAAAVIVIAAFSVFAGGPEKKQRIIGKLIYVNGKDVKIDRGSGDGVTTNMIFNVYLPAKMVHVPFSNKQLLVRENILGQVVISLVEKNISRGEFLNAKRLSELHERLSVSSVDESLAPEVNAPPTIRGGTLHPGNRVACGTNVEIVLDVFDADDERHTYHWTASGGTLLRKHSITAANTWRAPAEKGKYTVEVSVEDPAGKRDQRKFIIYSTGPAAERCALEVTNLLGRASARFTSAQDMAFDRAGNIYLVDGHGRMLVVLDESFRVKTHTSSYPSGMKFDRVAVCGSDIYFLDSYSQFVYSYTLKGSGDKNLFTRAKAKAKFGGSGRTNGYFAEAADVLTNKAGEVFVLDRRNPSVHLYLPDGTFAASTGKKGKGRGEMSRPTAMAISPDDTLYILDETLGKVLVYKDMRFSSEFKVGTAWNEFIDIAYNEKAGSVMVLGRKQKEVFCYSLDGKPMGKICDKAVITSGKIARPGKPERLFCDYTGRVYVLGSGGKVLSRYDSSGNFLGTWGGTDFSGVTRIAAAPDGGLFMLDGSSYKIYKFDKDGWLLAVFGGYGSSARGTFRHPVSLGVDSESNVYVLDAGDRCVKKFSPNGRFLKIIGRGAKLKDPVDMDVAGERIVVLDYGRSDCIHLFDTTGVKIAAPLKSGRLPYPFRVALDRNGTVYVFDRTPFIKSFKLDGSQGKRIKKRFDYVTGMAVDARSFLYLADNGRSVVSEVIPGKKDSIKITNGKFFHNPIDVAADALGNIYVLDGDTRRIVKLSRKQ